VEKFDRIISNFTYFKGRTIAAKILWSSLFDTSNVNQVLMSIYMTISNYSVVKNKVKHPKVCFTIECHLCHIDDQSILAAIVHARLS
jgi:hypothetical protein